MRPVNQQTILLTGASDGLGRSLAGELAEAGATVLLHGRDPERGRLALQEVRERSGSDRHRLYLADFASLAEVKRLADEVEHDMTASGGRLDALVNNAGIGPGRGRGARQLSRDGLELRFQVNHLAGFLLTQRLLPLLRRSAPARIVNVASGGQEPLDFEVLNLERGYSGMRAYLQSKLAQVMFTFTLAERLDPAEVTVTALHPASLMDTRMTREVGMQPASTVTEGAEATLRLIVGPELDGVTGRYFNGTRESRAASQAYDPSARQRLWEASEKLIAQHTER